MGRYSREEKKSISFKLLSVKNPGAMYKFIRSGKNCKDFFSVDVSHIEYFGFCTKEIKEFRDEFAKSAEAEINSASENNIDIIFQKDKNYPELLKEIYNSPEFIYVKGDKNILNFSKLAIVGSRKGSTYGKKVLSGIIPDITDENIAIVSGMAYGIDTISHLLAIKSGGKTIGVNAGGLLKIYPVGNSSITEKISENGCIISEFPLNTTPRPRLFPIRNRIIAGISKAVLIVEAELRSGSLITARLGLEQNRDILAIPGRIDSSLSKGTNYLIQQGAKLVTSSSDILAEFGIKKKVKKKIQIGTLLPIEKKILDLICKNDVNNINYLVENTGASVSETVTVIMGMVLKNLVVEEDGGFKSLL